MKKPEDEEPLDIIQKLVAAEEEEALRIFHSRSFSTRIKALIQAEEKSPRLPLLRRIPAPAWTGAGLAAVAWIIALIFIIPRPSRINHVRTIENILKRAPGARTLLDRTASLNGIETPSSPFESVIFRALGPSAKDPTSGALGKGEIAPRSTGPKIPRLGLEKTYEILMEEKSIERVLASLKKIKEV